MRRTVITLLGLCSLGAMMVWQLWACQRDECDPMMPRHCEGNAIVTCEHDSSERRYKLRYDVCGRDCADEGPDCGVYCVETTGIAPAATCARKTTPEPVCAGKLGSTCEGAKLICCHNGYVTGLYETCPSPELCVEGLLQCAVRPGKDPLCAGLVRGFVCDGNKKIECEKEYRVGEYSCTAAPYCYSVKFGSGSDASATTFCVQSLTPDPRCDLLLYSFGYDGHVREGCVGNKAVACADKVLLRENDCGDKVCTMGDSGSFCPL